MERSEWHEYSRYVLNSIKELKEMRDKMTQFQVELAVLKVKVAFWGAIGGVAGTIIGTVILQTILHLIREFKGGP